MLKYISIGCICSKGRTLLQTGFPKSPIYSAQIPIFVHLMIVFWLLVASVHEFARRNTKIVCINIFHEPSRCPEVLSMFKQLRVVEVRHLLYMSSDNLLKCVVKKKIPFVSVSSFKKTKRTVILLCTHIFQLCETLILSMLAALWQVA